MFGNLEKLTLGSHKLIFFCKDLKKLFRVWQKLINCAKDSFFRSFFCQLFNSCRKNFNYSYKAFELKGFSTHTIINLVLLKYLFSKTLLCSFVSNSKLENIFFRHRYQKSFEFIEKIY